MTENISTILQYRGFIWASVKRDFQARYQSSILGAAWLVLQPLAMILVYTLVFSQVMRARLPGETGAFSYSIFLCSGLLSWGLFAEQLNRSKNVFIENSNLIKKLTFPKACLPITITISACLNFLIIYTLFVLFLVFSGNFPGWSFFAVFPVLFLQVIFTAGLGLILGVLNVFFRDVGQLVDVGLQFLFWGTPIVYAISIVPDWAHVFIFLNPMAHFVNIYQDIMIKSQLPSWETIFQIGLVSFVFISVGIYMFKKHADDMVDEL